MKLFLSFVIATFISIGLIPLLIRWAKHLKMIDEPDARKVHTQAIPRCGGLGLAIATLLSAFTLLPMNAPFDSLLVGGAVIILFGVLDDMFDLNYKWKFFGQFIAVIYVIAHGVILKVLPYGDMQAAPLVLSSTLTFLFVVGVTNAVNLSDGLDGLAAGIMLMTLAAIAYLSATVGGNNLAVLAIALAGGIFGFLRFNTHPAIVFMGDTGSQFIGFLAAFLSIYLVQDVHQTLNPALPLLLLGLPVLDTLSVMTLRISSGRSPFSPDKCHIHHRLLAMGFSHGATVGVIYILQSIYLIAAFSLRYFSDSLVLIGYLTVSLGILALLLFAERKQWKIKEKVGKERRGFLRRFGWLYQACRRYIEYALILFVIFIAGIILSLVHISDKEAMFYIGFIALFSLLKKSILDGVSKLSIYIIGIYSAFLLTPDRFEGFAIDFAVNIYLVLLFLVVFLAIRITRRSVFSLSTQDVLITFFAFSIIVLSDSQLAVDILTRLMCLGYAVEYLLNFSRNYRLLRFVSLATGVLILTRMMANHLIV